MNTTTIRRRWLGQPAASALLGAALLLGGCAASASSGAHRQSSASPSAPLPNPSTATAPAAPATTALLTCAVASQLHGADTIVIILTCAVHGAPASDTAFALTYAATSSTGSHALAPACAGALSAGRGSCAQRYTVPATFDLAKSAVTGALQPGQQSLGPLTPTSAPTGVPTPIGLPIPYVFPTPKA